MEIENKHIEDLLFGYFAGELSEAEEKELLLWLDADEAHTKLLSEMADWWAIAHVPLFASDMKADFDTHFGHLKNQYSIPETKSNTLNLALWGRIVASFLLLASVGSFFYYMGKNQNPDPSKSLVYFKTVTPLGAQTKVVLPDHSVVWMNAGSTLKYSTEFNDKQRVVSLNGEAYFEVAPDSLKPFVVKSEKLDILVRGTHFNLKAYSEDESVDVALITGKVNVHLTDRSSNNGEVTLIPNRMLSYNKETNCVKVAKVNAADATLWTTGGFKFVEQSFLQIAKDLERKYNVKIRIHSKSLEKEVFSGSFSSDHTLNEILREVDVDRKYTWSKSNGQINIKDK